MFQAEEFLEQLAGWDTTELFRNVCEDPDGLALNWDWTWGAARIKTTLSANNWCNHVKQKSIKGSL